MLYGTEHVRNQSILRHLRHAVRYVQERRELVLHKHGNKLAHTFVSHSHDTSIAANPSLLAPFTGLTIVWAILFSHRVKKLALHPLPKARFRPHPTRRGARHHRRRSQQRRRYDRRPVQPSKLLTNKANPPPVVSSTVSSPAYSSTSRTRSPSPPPVSSSPTNAPSSSSSRSQSP